MNRNLVSVCLFLMTGTVAALACDAEAEHPDPAVRGGGAESGKADLLEGSCAGVCGDSNKAAGCFCDAWCAEYGDCCADVAPQCGLDYCLRDNQCRHETKCEHSEAWGANVCGAVATCGNGVIDPGESCDPGVGSSAACGEAALPCGADCQAQGTLQDRIDVACDGDVICVGSLEVPANVIVQDKTLTLRGDCETPRTIWRCADRNDRAITARSGADLTIEGFEFTGCDGNTQDALQSGVVLLDGADVVRLRDSFIHGNSSHRGPVVSTYRGSGMPTDGFVELRNNIMVDNFANDAGVVYIAGETNLEIVNNLIYDNHASDYSAAVWLRSQRRNKMEFTKNVVYQNVAARAAALEVHTGDGPVIDSSIVAHNQPDNLDAAWGTYRSAIGGNPDFVDPADGDFRLAPGSDLVDTGNPALMSDPDGSPPDKGVWWHLLPVQ